MAIAQRPFSQGRGSGPCREHGEGCCPDRPQHPHHAQQHGGLQHPAQRPCRVVIRRRPSAVAHRQYAHRGQAKRSCTLGTIASQFATSIGRHTVDPVRQIQDFNARRDPERLLMKYRAMRASPFAFLRGTCHLFYARLPRGGVFKSAPRVWTCGDLHLENFGSYKGDNRLVHFDINDFDEAALAPASWDLLRLLTSLRVAAHQWALSAAHEQSLCQHYLDAYAGGLMLGKAYWMERDTAQGVVRTLLDGLRDRKRPQFLDARTTIHLGQRQLRVDGKKALPATAAQRKKVMAFVQDFASRQPDPHFYTALDVARRVAGTGSLGLDRYVILVHGKGSPDGNYLLDLKRAQPSSLLQSLKVAQPQWPSEAHRIVAAQVRMQAVPVAFLHPVSFRHLPYVLRALQPSEDRVDLNRSRHHPGQRESFIAGLGRLTAWAQLRSTGRDGSASADELIDFGRRLKWQGRLLEASDACAQQVMQDAAAYNLAWDGGAFGA